MQIRSKTISVFFCLLLGGKIFISCLEKPLTEADVSAFGPFVERLDTLLLEKSLKVLLDTDTSSWKADLAVKKRYQDFHKLIDAPVWYDRMGLKADADTVFTVLKREVMGNGLDGTAFSIPQLEKDFELVHSLAFDSLRQDINEVLPRLDYLLSKAYVRFTVGQRFGFMRPDAAFNHLDEKLPLTDEEKEAYKKKKESEKEYLRLFDYSIVAPSYNEAVNVLISYEQRLDFLLASRPKGPVYEALRSQYDQAANPEERHQLAVNMERCRWQIPQPPMDSSRVIVNIAAQHLWAVSSDSVLSMRICCGSTKHKTPLLNSKIKYMQVNPDWIVPRNIVKTDFLHHEGDSAYFARNNYYIVDKTSGDTLNPVEVSRAEMLESYIRIGQRSGGGNSLGRIVFRFDNDFGVYLHDTNNRGAFKRERRTLSHGCVRVQKPFELACFLLPDVDEWTLDCLRISIDMSPETQRGKKYLKEHADAPRPFRLITYHDINPRVPVFIIYYTVYPNPETGKLESWKDLYGYDQVISKAIPFLQ